MQTMFGKTLQRAHGNVGLKYRYELTAAGFKPQVTWLRIRTVNRKHVDMTSIREALREVETGRTEESGRPGGMTVSTKKKAGLITEDDLLPF